MINESGSIPSSNYKGAWRGCTNWKVFIVRGVRQGELLIRERIIFGPGHLRGAQWHGFLKIMHIASLYGGKGRPTKTDYPSCASPENCRLVD